jgi:hypothetical protein
MTRSAVTTRFSIGEALQTPFLLLRHQPLAVFAWGAMRVVLTIAAFSLLLPMLAAMPFGQADTPEEMQRVMTNFVPIQGGIGLMNIFGLLLSVIIWTAAMRATMSPAGTKDRFLFLRLGFDEVYVGVVMLVIVVGLYFGTFVLTLIGAVMCAILWQMSEVAAVVITIVYGLAVFAAALWAAGRVTLAIPASLALHTIAFEQGWRLGKGQGWRLAATGVLAWLILMIMTMVIGALMIAVFFVAALILHVSLPNPGDIHSFADLAEFGRPFLIPALVLAVPLALFDGFTHAIFGAPVASACKQLMDGAEIPNGGDADPTPAL